MSRNKLFGRPGHGAPTDNIRKKKFTEYQLSEETRRVHEHPDANRYDKDKSNNDNNRVNKEWELGVVVSELGTQSKGCGFESHLCQILHVNGVKAMPG